MGYRADAKDLVREHSEARALRALVTALATHDASAVARAVLRLRVLGATVPRGVKGTGGAFDGR